MPRHVIATEAPLTDSDLPCPSCGRWVRTTGDLIEHESVHADRFEDACPVCGAQGQEICATPSGRDHRKRILLLLELDRRGTDRTSGSRDE